MPYKSKKPCRYPGCRALVDNGWCAAHQPKREPTKYEVERGSSAQRGYNGRWQKARATFLREHPLCVACLAESSTTAATVVDHIKPHRLHDALAGNDDDEIRQAQALFWNTSNWQALCKRHHDVKTATEDGGFGRPRVREAGKSPDS
ncbi:hypothetical protein JCM19000A_25550 [Silvimonas sp. JCM 19000]